MSRVVTEAVNEAWHARENCIARVQVVQFPSLRITRNALDSFSQVRRLLGMRIVAAYAWGLAKLCVATVAFGDAQLFPQDRVRMPAHGRAWRMRRADTSNFFVLRFA